mmetsp:Transcript_57370/g.90993  ORF Transcript_57370/g.90993 Transcript_57370/m.90993 type:complete len:208 (+) Transcript_57370:981-1604(+)
MRTSTICFRTFFKIFMRSPWSMSPCNVTHFFSRKSLKFCVSSSAVAMDFTNMSSCPFARMSLIFFDSHAHFSVSFCFTTIVCLMFLAAWPSSPTVTRTGADNRSRASRSIFGGNVAEKNSVCRAGRMACTIERTWYSNPICSIRSASSITRNVTRLILHPFILMISMSLPGLQTTISHPRFISLNCSSLERPPANVTLRKPKRLLNL